MAELSELASRVAVMSGRPVPAGAYSAVRRIGSFVRVSGQVATDFATGADVDAQPVQALVVEIDALAVAT